MMGSYTYACRMLVIDEVLVSLRLGRADSAQQTAARRDLRLPIRL